MKLTHDSNILGFIMQYKPVLGYYLKIVLARYLPHPSPFTIQHHSPMRRYLNHAVGISSLSVLGHGGGRVSVVLQSVSDSIRTAVTNIEKVTICIRIMTT